MLTSGEGAPGRGNSDGTFRSCVPGDCGHGEAGVGQQVEKGESQPVDVGAVGWPQPGFLTENGAGWEAAG